MHRRGRRPTPARRAASATDTPPRNTDNTTCSLRSGLIFEGLATRNSLHQTQPTPEQEFLTRDIATRPLRLNTFRFGYLCLRRRRSRRVGRRSVLSPNGFGAPTCFAVAGIRCLVLADPYPFAPCSLGSACRANHGHRRVLFTRVAPPVVAVLARSRCEGFRPAMLAGRFRRVSGAVGLVMG